MNKSKIEERLLKIFPTQPIPGKQLDEICASNQGDAPEIISQFQGVPWNEITLDLLNEHFDAVSYFTPKGLRYYMPAVILHSLNNFCKVELIIDGLLSTLEDSTENFKRANAAIDKYGPDGVRPLSNSFSLELNAKNKEVWSALDDEQISLVMDWLKWIEENNFDDTSFAQLAIEIADWNNWQQSG